MLYVTTYAQNKIAQHIPRLYKNGKEYAEKERM